MSDVLTTSLVVAVAQATVIPLLLTLTKQEHKLGEVIVIAAISGLCYLVPTAGAFLSYISMLGLLFWRLRPDDVVTGLFLPVGAARLLCVPVLMVVNAHAA